MSENVLPEPITPAMAADADASPLAMVIGNPNVRPWQPSSGDANALAEAVATLETVYRTILKSDTDFGIIPGTAKPTLLKPGAEKLLRAFGLSYTPVVEDAVERFTDTPFFRYRIRGIVRNAANGVIVAEAWGESNSMENRYRRRGCPDCGGAVWDNRDQKRNGKFAATAGDFACKDKAVCRWEGDATAERFDFSLVNSILKMAHKRALVGAVLTATGASSVFAQDQEDATDPDAPAAAASTTPAASPTKAVMDQRLAVYLEGDRGLTEAQLLSTARRHAKAAGVTQPRSMVELVDLPEAVVTAMAGELAERFSA